VDGVLADSAGGAWSFGGSILTFAFPMILFTVVAVALYVLYTKPEVVPGHRAPTMERPLSYTALPGKPTADREAPLAEPAETGGTAEAAGTTDSEAAGSGDGE
jgi:hypothetical protein